MSGFFIVWAVLECVGRCCNTGSFEKYRVACIGNGCIDTNSCAGLSEWLGLEVAAFGFQLRALFS